MSKATEQELAALHGALARGLTDIVSNGAEVATKEGAVRVTAPAAYFGAAVALLKNNNITADPTTDAGLKGLAEALQAKRNARKKGMVAFEDAAVAFGESLGQDGFPGLVN